LKQKTRSRKHFILKAEIPGMGYLIETITIVVVMVIVIALVIVIVIITIRVSLIVLVILTTRCVHNLVRK